MPHLQSTLAPRLLRRSLRYWGWLASEPLHGQQRSWAALRFANRAVHSAAMAPVPSASPRPFSPSHPQPARCSSLTSFRCVPLREGFPALRCRIRAGFTRALPPLLRRVVVSQAMPLRKSGQAPVQALAAIILDQLMVICGVSAIIYGGAAKIALFTMGCLCGVCVYYLILSAFFKAYAQYPSEAKPWLAATAILFCGGWLLFPIGEPRHAPLAAGRGAGRCALASRRTAPSSAFVPHSLSPPPPPRAS